MVVNATKGAAEQIVRVLAKDLGEKGVTVNAIAPGPVNTDSLHGGVKDPAFMEFIAGMHPQKRVPEADEIAPLVAFLAKDDAGWINGQTIMINGVSPMQFSFIQIS